MATDFDAPRRNEADEPDSDSLEQLRAVDPKRAKQAQVDEVDASENDEFELPGADLSGEVLEVTVAPRGEREFTCSSCFLIHDRATLVQADPPLCRDCA